MFPPSPALSLVDSLDGIEDLEAYLDAQPALSQFPTPPTRVSKNAKGLGRVPSSTAGFVTPHVRHQFDEGPCRNSQNEALDYSTAARTLATTANLGTSLVSADIDLIRNLLIRANLSWDLLAFALNILVAYRHRREACPSEQAQPPHSSSSSPCPIMSTDSCSLLIISALSLAVSYTTDQPPPKSWWVRHVGESAWSGHSLHTTTLKVLSALDWRLHSCSSDENLQHARTELSHAEVDDDECQNSTTAVMSSRHRLKVDLLSQSLRDDRDDGHAGLGHGAGGRHAVWETGLVTPDEEEQSVLSRFPSRATSVVALTAATTTTTTASPVQPQFLQLL